MAFRRLVCSFFVNIHWCFLCFNFLFLDRKQAGASKVNEAESFALCHIRPMGSWKGGEKRATISLAKKNCHSCVLVACFQCERLFTA